MGELGAGLSREMMLALEVATTAETAAGVDVGEGSTAEGTSLVVGMSSVMGDRWARTLGGTMPWRSEIWELFRWGGPDTYAGKVAPEAEAYVLIVGPDNAIPTAGFGSLTRLVVLLLLLFPLVKCDLYTLFR